jgi:hypothetical protein
MFRLTRGISLAPPKTMHLLSHTPPPQSNPLPSLHHPQKNHSAHRSTRPPSSRSRSPAPAPQPATSYTISYAATAIVYSLQNPPTPPPSARHPAASKDRIQCHSTPAIRRYRCPNDLSRAPLRLCAHLPICVLRGWPRLRLRLRH